MRRVKRIAKGVNISLAAKCQLLFGLAVLVIIAGALAVPWQRMEQLTGQLNVKPARMLADEHFRRIHHHAQAATQASLLPTTAPSVSATTSAPATTEPSAISLLDLPDYPSPRIVKLASPKANLKDEDALTRQALEIFRTSPNEIEFGKAVTLSDKSRVYRYAAAIRLERSCLNCHSEWVSWVKPPTGTPSTPTTLPAMPMLLTTQPTTPRNDTTASSVTASTNPTSISPTNWPLVAILRVDVPWQMDENQSLLNRIVIVVAGILGGTLAVGVFYLITSKLILQPVRVLKNTAEKVSKGDLNIRSAISTGDEFQHLSETFNQMLTTLKASQDQLENTNRALDARVGELAQSNVDLYEANRLKSEFLANVSHELRTPLNAIIGFADLLADNPITKEPKIARWTDNIRNSSKQLLDLINDLLDLAKIEAGKMVLRQEKLNVPDTCEAVLNFMRPLAQKKNIELTLDAQDHMPLIITDPGRFQQILYNFMSNAIKFTPQDGKVAMVAKVIEPPAGATASSTDGATTGEEVRAGRVEPTHIQVSVTDNGPGIPLELQKQIFEKFRQIDGSVTRQHSGTGLGLAISRELTSMLGGHIELQSEVGKGTTFTLILPIQTQSPLMMG